uniref:Uncharacterized protein n=1 Tax=Hucho hucho TaxID=62062 RepID=A0A4W5MYJ4_9TELE
TTGRDTTGSDITVVVLTMRNRGLVSLLRSCGELVSHGWLITYRLVLMLSLRVGQKLHKSLYGMVPVVLESVWTGSLCCQHLFMLFGSRWESPRSIPERVQLFGP